MHRAAVQQPPPDAGGLIGACLILGCGGGQLQPLVRQKLEARTGESWANVDLGPWLLNSCCPGMATTSKPDVCWIKSSPGRLQLVLSGMGPLLPLGKPAASDARANPCLTSPTGSPSVPTIGEDGRDADQAIAPAVRAASFADRRQKAQRSEWVA